MTTDELEALSEKVRRGEPIGFGEGIAVIEHQESLRVSRERRGFWSRLRQRLGLGEIDGR